MTRDVEQPADIYDFTTKQREEAEQKAAVVQQYRRAGKSVADFIADHNRDNPGVYLTESTLMYWQRRFNTDGIVGLIDRRGGWNRGRSSISTEAWEYFYGVYVTLKKPSIRMAYDATVCHFPNVPSIRTFRRTIQQQNTKEK